MNARDKNAELTPRNIEDALQTLPGLGYFDDDIQSQLHETTKSIAQDIVDLLSQQYRQARIKHGATKTLPQALWKPLRAQAYALTAEHCEKLATNLRKASKNPNMSL